MDQIRKILAWLKQYHFWVLSVLVAFIGLFCWWSAAGAISKQYDTNQKEITSKFQDLNTVRSDAFHPNDDVQTRQKDEISKLSTEVKEIWTKLYDAQSENVLKWPSGPGELKPEFITTVDKLEFGAEIPDDLREHYQNYIFRHFPKLPEKIGAQPLDESQAATAGGGGRSFSRLGAGPSVEGPMAMTAGGQMDDNDYICEWATEDQAAVRAELEFPQTPSSLRIWCTQENIWVYHALLDVIRNTNQAANATRMSNAAVRGIYSLEVGQRAAPKSRTPNRIHKLATATASPVPGEGGEFPSGEAPAGPGAGREFPTGAPMEFRSGLAEGGAEMSEAEERSVLLDFRYLGEDGKPVRLAGGGGGGEPGEVAPDPSIPAPPLDLSMFGKEYKRLPVRMVLEMDQRHLPKLISECAIQPLQIEVQEVRVNVPDAMDGTGGGGGGGSIPGMRGGYGEGGGASMAPELTGLQAFNPQPQIVTVVIQGVIYIFNKPNEALLNPSGDAAAAGAVAVQ